jgi:hypothetical protein
MEAASTSETSVNFYQTTWCCNPEDSHLVSELLGQKPEDDMYNPEVNFM